MSTMHGCVVLWLIGCALTVVSTMCAGNRRRCPSFKYTTACDAAHGSRSSRILFLPGGRGAAALSPWRRGATGWAHARTHEERPARASTAKLLWCARNVLCVAHACGLAVCVRGQLLLACVVMSRGFALPCWWFPVGRTINEPATPRVTLLAELNCRCACEMFVFSWKCELFSWVCMVDGSHKRREGACFWATEIPPCRTPMSSNWVLDVRN